MSVLNTGSSHQRTPQNGGDGGAFFVGAAVLGGIAYFWPSIAWFFGALYGYLAGFIGWVGGALSGALEMISGLWGAVGSAAAIIWSGLAGLVLATWSAALSLAVLVWTLAATTLAMDGWIGTLAWDYFGVYLLFGLATGLIFGLMKSWLRLRSRKLEEIVKAIGSPNVVTAARVGAIGIAYEVAVSLALSAVLGIIGLAVPYLLGGFATPIVPGGPLEFALDVAGGPGGIGGGGFGAGAGGAGPGLVLLLCGLIVLMAIVVGALVAGVASIFTGGIAASAASALAAGAQMAGHSIGHAGGKNLIVALARTRRQRDALQNGDAGRGAVYWRMRMIASGIRIGAILGVFFSLWLTVSLIIQGRI